MKIIILFFFVTIASISSAQTLKEKQAMANLDFSWAEKRINENYGLPVKIEVDKASFAGDVDAIQYADSRGAVMAANALSKICEYTVGKDALKEKKISKIILKNIHDGKYKVEIKTGVLTLFNGFSSSENYFGESELKEAIENIL